MPETKENFFDAHCHAGENGGGGRLLCGTGRADWPMVARAAAAWPGTIAAYGLHPWHAAEAETDSRWMTDLEHFLTRDAAAWMGEIGLDAARRGIADAKTQEEAFRAQLRLAARLGRRVNLHCVKAWEPLVRLLDREYLSAGTGEKKFIVHSFSGPFQYIDSLAGRGAYFSVGARVTDERARRLPLDRILLESDAFPAPDALETTFNRLAEVRGLDRSALAGAIHGNTARLFGREVIRL